MASSDFEGREFVDLLIDILFDKSKVVIKDDGLHDGLKKSLEVLGDELNAGNFEPSDIEAFAALEKINDDLDKEEVTVPEVEENGEEDDDDEAEEDEDDEEDEEDEEFEDEDDDDFIADENGEVEKI